MKSNPNRMSTDAKSNISQRFPQINLPPLHNNDVLLLPQRPLSSISSNESLSDSMSKKKKKFFNLFLRFLAQFSTTSGDSYPVSSQTYLSPIKEPIRYEIQIEKLIQILSLS
jgi:hypothetical protein